MHIHLCCKVVVFLWSLLRCLFSFAAIINLVKFVLSNETVLLKKFDVFVLCTRVCLILLLFLPKTVLCVCVCSFLSAVVLNQLYQ